MDEEQRLAAQRRMLAEKYGLHASDDEDESVQGSENADHMQGEDPDKGKGGGNDKQPEPGAPGGETEAPGKRDTSSSGAGDQPRDQPRGDASSLWPGMRFSCPMQAKKLPAEYRYCARDHAAATAKRECRVTPITKYPTLYQETAGRRIAGADKFVAYAVGGHIRVIGRGSQRNLLLKGHGSNVCDLEFARKEGGDLDAGQQDGLHTAVVASVAEDGSVFIWKLLRDDDPEDDDAQHGEDGQVQPTLEKLDSLTLRHPKEGRWYQRVLFRPVEGAVLSDSGMGVAVMLLDTSSPEVRVTELVKMGDKSKVLDRFISGGHTSGHGDGLAAAAWLSKDAIATARGHEVCVSSLADPRDIKKLATLDRPAASVVSSLHLLQRGKGFSILLVAADGGSVMEVWSIVADKKPVIVQRLVFDMDGEGDAFNVVACDSQVREYIAVSSLRHNALFVLHYRPDRACLDAITQLPVKQSVLSLCMTQNLRKVVSDNVRGLPEEKEMQELGIWCVMPNVIHMMHAYAADCAPKEQSTVRVLEAADTNGAVVAPSVAGSVPCAEAVSGGNKPHAAVAGPPEASSVANSSKLEEASKAPVENKGSSLAGEKSASAAEAKAGGVDALLTTRAGDKQISILKKPSFVAPAAQAQSTTSTSAVASSAPQKASGASRSPQSKASITADSEAASEPGVVAARSAEWEAKSKNGRPDAPTSPDVSANSKRDRSSLERGTTDTSTTFVTAGASARTSATGADPDSAARSIDEIVAIVSAAAHKVAADFDAEGVKREAAEMTKVPKLVSKVRQLAEASMETLVTKALKKPMTDAIIPVVSEIVSESSAALARASSRADAASAESRERSTAALKMTPQWFAQSFRDAGLGSSFAAACTEMERQASSAVKDSMAQKHSVLVKPSVSAVEAAATDLSAASRAFTEAVQESVSAAQFSNGGGRGRDGNADGGGGVVDVRERIAGLMAEKEVAEALAVAAGSADPEVAIELCERIDAAEFFENECLSQTATLGLIRLLGSNLSQATSLKVGWLKELLLVLEPHDEEIVATAPPTLQQLMGNTEMLKLDKELLSANPGLGRDVKMLSMLVSSQDG